MASKENLAAFNGCPMFAGIQREQVPILAAGLKDHSISKNEEEKVSDDLE